MAEKNVFVARSQALRREKRFADALTVAKEAVRVYPDDANGWWQLALNHRSLDQGDEFETAMLRVLDLAPFFVDGLQTLAAHYFKTNNTEQALELLDTALERDPQHIPSLRLLTEMLRFSEEPGDWARAIRTYEALEEVDELYPDELFNLAYLHGRQGNHLASARTYERYLGEERTGGAFSNLAMAYQKLLRGADAMDAFRLSAHIRPDNAASKRWLELHAREREKLRASLGSTPSPYLPEADWYRHYVNPFQLLDVDPLDVQGNVKALQKARQALLREVELEENKVGWMPGLTIDRSSILALCEKLNDEDVWNAHEWVRNNELLNEFLSKGDIAYFSDDSRPESLLELTALLPEPLADGVGDAFALQFDDVLTRAIEKLDIPAIEALLSGRRLVLPQQQERCFEGARRAAKRLVEPLHALREQADKSPVSLQKVQQVMQSTSIVHLSRVLSIDFHDVHQSICRDLRGISIALFNSTQKTQEALDILKLSATSASHSASLLHQYEADQRQLEEMMAQAKKHEVNLTVSQKSFVITSEGVKFGTDWIPAAEVQGIRWGMTATSQSTWQFLVAFTSGLREIEVAWNVSNQIVEEQKKFMARIVEAAMAYLMDHTMRHMEAALARPGGLAMGNIRANLSGVTFKVKGFLWDSEHTCSWARVRSVIDSGHLVLQANDNPKATAALALATHYNAYLLKIFADRKVQ